MGSLWSVPHSETTIPITEWTRYVPPISVTDFPPPSSTTEDRGAVFILRTNGTTRASSGRTISPSYRDLRNPMHLDGSATQVDGHLSLVFDLDGLTKRDGHGIPTHLCGLQQHLGLLQPPESHPDASPPPVLYLRDYWPAKKPLDLGLASSSDGRITEFWELGTRMDPFQRTFDQPCAWMEDCIGQVTGGHYGGGVPTPFNLFAIDWTAMVCAAIKGNSDSVLRHLQTAEANRDPAYLERLYQCVQEMVPAPENVSTASSGEALPGFTWDPAHRGSVFGWSTDLKSGQWSVHLNCHTFVVAFLRVVFDWNIPPEIGLISNIDQVLVQTTLVAQQAAPTSYT